MANLVRATELLDELAKQFENGSRGWVLCQQLRVVLCDDDPVRAGEAPVALLAGLRAYRDVHQQWVVHLEHCAGCDDCAANVVAQVGTLEKHQRDVAFYDCVIAEVKRGRVSSRSPEPQHDVLPHKYNDRHSCEACHLFWCMSRNQADGVFEPCECNCDLVPIADTAETKNEVYRGRWALSASGEYAWRVNNLWLRPQHPTRWMPFPALSSPSPAHDLKEK